jgi:hypothetical protein
MKKCLQNGVECMEMNIKHSLWTLRSFIFPWAKRLAQFVINKLMSTLLDELWTIVVVYLDVNDLFQLQQCCNKLHFICDMNSLWEQRLLAHFPKTMIEPLAKQEPSCKKIYQHLSMLTKQYLTLDSHHHTLATIFKYW